jgi:esterase/lipase superfamily enzyme
MRRLDVQIPAPELDTEMRVLAIGHAGLPVLVFPSSEGAHHEYEDYLMARVMAPLLEQGRLRLYCVSSYDAQSWYGSHVPLHDRAFRHHLYERWVMNEAMAFIADDTGDPDVQLVTTGVSFGAYHAANFALKHPRRFPHALCLSGVYDLRFLMHGHTDDWVYFNNPMEFLHHLDGEDLEAVRRNTFLTLVCGQGEWEDHALASTRAFRDLLDARGVPNHMDLWGHDVSHDWHWWREQMIYFANHLAEGTLPWRPMSLA